MPRQALLVCSGTPSFANDDLVTAVAETLAQAGKLYTRFRAD
jgi:hypothetical protein